jgi:hypothetical protein
LPLIADNKKGALDGPAQEARYLPENFRKTSLVSKIRLIQI